MHLHYMMITFQNGVPLRRQWPGDVRLHPSIALATTDQTSVKRCINNNIVLSNVSRIQLKWSSSTARSWFFHLSINFKTVKLIVSYRFLYWSTILFRTGPFLRLAPSAANGFYGINLSWYLAISKCKHLKVFVDSLYKKIIDIDQHLLNLCQNVARVRNFFEPHRSSINAVRPWRR